MKFIVDQQVEDIELPENLKLNTFLQEFHHDCPHKECDFGFYGFAFGQSPFGVPRTMQEALKKHADKGKYADVPGIAELRSTIAEYNRHYFGFGVDSDSVYVGPGTKEILYNLLEVLHGTVILPTPAWIGYLPQIRFLKKNYHMLPADHEKKISPESLKKLALRLQDRQKILILNNPNNPTGLVYSRLELEEIADVCREQEIVVVSDELYAQTTFEAGAFHSMGKIYPEGTFVTNGLSKSHAAGGYRLGYVIFPPDADALGQQFKKIIATEYTSVSTPIQHAAIAGFTADKEMDEYFEVTRRIHEIMADYTYHMLTAAGVGATKPQATFYLLADFNRYAHDFAGSKIPTSQRFAESLIQHPYHTAVVGGDSLVLERTDYSARMAYIDYDGASAFANYLDSKPKTASDKVVFAEQNAPRIKAGIEMIDMYLKHLRQNAASEIDCKRDSLEMTG